MQGEADGEAGGPRIDDDLHGRPVGLWLDERLQLSVDWQGGDLIEIADACGRRSVWHFGHAGALMGVDNLRESRETWRDVSVTSAVHTRPRPSNNST